MYLYVRGGLEFLKITISFYLSWRVGTQTQARSQTLEAMLNLVIMKPVKEQSSLARTKNCAYLAIKIHVILFSLMEKVQRKCYSL